MTIETSETISPLHLLTLHYICVYSKPETVFMTFCEIQSQLSSSKRNYEDYFYTSLSLHSFPIELMSWREITPAFAKMSKLVCMVLESSSTVGLLLGSPLRVSCKWFLKDLRCESLQIFLNKLYFIFSQSSENSRELQEVGKDVHSQCL